jgi:tetratricopeptide (TPR) repeat protein
MADPRDDDGEAFRRALQAALARAPLPLEPAELESICDDFLGRPAGQQLTLARNSRRVGRLEVCWRLIGRSEALRHQDPPQMLTIARAAVRLAEALPDASPSASLVADARAEAWACLANALRVVGDLPAAEDAWRTADAYLEEGTAEPLIEARLRVLKSSLRLTQGRTAEAIRLLRRSYRAYRRLGDPHLAARTLISLARAYEREGRLPAAIRAVYLGGRQLDAGREPDLLLVAVHNLIHYLGEAECSWEALTLLREAEPLYRLLGGRVISLRMRWMESRLLLSVGHPAEALATLGKVRQSFLDLGMTFDAALAALELATTHAAAGRHEEVARLAEEMYPIFISRGISDEALATLSLFVQAAERREATAELLARLCRRLEKLGNRRT